jgi:Tse6 toxin immunity protein Tsi6
MPSSIISFSEFSQRLDSAIADVGKLAAIDRDPMIGSIQRQLGFVKQWTQGGIRPAQADLDKLTFGQMASRSVHETDSRLANELYELSSYLIFWPSSEPVRT